MLCLWNIGTMLTALKLSVLAGLVWILLVRVLCRLFPAFPYLLRLTIKIPPLTYLPRGRKLQALYCPVSVTARPRPLRAYCSRFSPSFRPILLPLRSTLPVRRQAAIPARMRTQSLICLISRKSSGKLKSCPERSPIFGRASRASLPPLRRR